LADDLAPTPGGEKKKMAYLKNGKAPLQTVTFARLTRGKKKRKKKRRFASDQRGVGREVCVSFFFMIVKEKKKKKRQSSCFGKKKTQIGVRERKEGGFPRVRNADGARKKKRKIERSSKHDRFPQKKKKSNPAEGLSRPLLPVALVKMKKKKKKRRRLPTPRKKKNNQQGRESQRAVHKSGGGERKRRKKQQLLVKQRFGREARKKKKQKEKEFAPSPSRAAPKKKKKRGANCAMGKLGAHRLPHQKRCGGKGGKEWLKWSKDNLARIVEGKKKQCWRKRDSASAISIRTRAYGGEKKKKKKKKAGTLLPCVEG